MKLIKQHDEIIIQIEKMAIGGSGVARHNGLVIFVPYSAPLDVVKVKIETLKKNFATASIVEIIRAGPSRRTPPCPALQAENKTLCGGCNWQHINEEEQLQQKKNLVLESLQKALKNQSIPEPKLFKSPRHFNYRNRIQLKYKNKKLGFYARQSHEIVNIQECLIAEEKINSSWEEIRGYAQAHKNPNQASLQIECFIDEKSNNVKYYHYNESSEVFGFSQVNRFQNADLIQYVLEIIAPDFFSHIYDLYAGSGNFTYPILREKKTITTAVELNSKLTERAEAHKLLQFVTSDVDEFTSNNSFKQNALIILDPPRAGSSENTMKRLAKSGALKIIYISCHPMSLARDLKWFFDHCKNSENKCLYKISHLGIFEMFPQTDHVETIVELTKQKS